MDPQVRARLDAIEAVLARIENAAGAGAAAEAALNGLSLQAGTGVLVNGASAAIAATITATSRILAVKANALGGAGSGTDLSIPTASRIVGAPGSFVVQAVNADNTNNAVDDSTFDWFVIN